jgi:GT2 family glycosyltransferase/glycosyltransferase involved in cell wall biosynthesis
VIPRTWGLFPSQVEASRLQSLFSSIGTAVDEGRLQEALRLADCARRISPADPTSNLVHARLLIRLGAASEAAERLRYRAEPEAIAARAEALYMDGAFDDAAASIEDLLRRLAVDSVENLRHLATRLCRLPSKFPGWIGVDSNLRLVGAFRIGTPLEIEYVRKIYRPSISVIDRDGVASFEFQMPVEGADRIRAFTGDIELLGSGFAWPPEFGLAGWVMLENARLVGKARLGWAPTLPTTVAITPAGGECIRLSIPPTAGSEFSVPLSRWTCDVSEIEVAAVLPDGKYSRLFGSPVRVRPTAPFPIGIRPKRTIHIGQTQPRSSGIVDIIVPVYAGFNETLLCLEQVLATTARTDAELIVVNDASPDSQLCDALARLAQAGRITLLTNSHNLGFPGAANRGMSLHPERDVVLLNSDAAVFGDWLDRLKSAAYCADDIGTVTPLGETASIMSYPGGEKRAKTRIEPDMIDRIARDVNAGRLVDLPVGVGFCFYVKRACLDQVGCFDNSSFAEGYGEENDFCLRARRHGWRHVGAANLFVGHPGGRSFGPAREPLMERNRRVLDALHPGYANLIADFVAADPLLSARRAIDAHRLVQEATAPVLLVTFDLPGGVRRHVDLRESELSAGGQTVLTLQPAGAGRHANQVILRTHDSRFENLVYNLPQEAPVLRDLLSALGLSNIELHHFVGLPETTLDLVTGLGVSYDVYVHDYSWICPRINLIGANNVYCGEPPIEDCETCIRINGTDLDPSLTVAALRARSARILKAANRIIVPTEDVRGRFDRYFPNVSVNVTGWERTIQPLARPSVSQERRIHVAVIGAISIQKGYEILLQCAQDAAERDLALDFVVIGYTSDDASLLATGRVFITGPYAEDEIGALLEREQCHIALFPSVAPETWCYALTHAIRRRLPIVAFDLGAIAERLSAYDAADLLPLSTKAADLNDLLLRSVRGITIPEIQKELDMSDSATTNDPSVSQELEATVKVLTLPVGVFSFTVQGGAAAISGEELAVPALQLGLAPMQSEGTVEFLAGAGTLDRWLTRSSDTFIVRIYGGSVALLLTSVRLPGSPALTINVQRIDVEPEPATSELPGSQAATDGAHGVLPAQILAHIENFGDIYFNRGWVGFIGQKLRIEAFAILSVGPLGPDSIEYRGVVADGFETPWLSDQLLCGSRGRGMPLTGYAIRLKPDIAGRYDCAYFGKFVSGRTLGPFTAGDICCSSEPGDPLEAMEVRVTERVATKSHAPGQEIQYSDAS